MNSPRFTFQVVIEPVSSGYRALVANFKNGLPTDADGQCEVAKVEAGSLDETVFLIGAVLRHAAGEAVVVDTFGE